MIQGLNTFKAFFEGYEDHYTLIGGVACYARLIILKVLTFNNKPSKP